MTALGMSVGAIALAAVPVAGLWTVLAVKLGSKQEILARPEVKTT
jgi:hypothetical protein